MESGTPEGTLDLITRLRASKARAKSPAWCQVHAANVQAAIDLLTQYNDRHAHQGAPDLIAKLRASKAGVPFYDWCQVETSTLLAAGNLLENCLAEAGPPTGSR